MRKLILPAVAVLLSVPPAPASPAMAAACTWGATQLAVPIGHSLAVVNGAADNAPLIAGHAVRSDGSGNDAVVWHDGVPQVLPNPPGPDSGSNRADDVNDSGVVAGVWRGASNLDTPWRYENGVYQLLPANPPTPWYGELSMNNVGDIIGVGFSFFSSAGALWKAAAPGVLTNLGDNLHAVGIDDSGRYVLNTGVIVNPDGSRITLPRDVFLRSYSRGRILSEDLDRTTIVEWNIAGQVTREFAGQGALWVNAAGLIVGSPRTSVYQSVRNGSVWEAMTPPVTNIRDITNGGIAVGNYNHDGDTSTPTVGGVWRRSCS